MYTMYLKTQQNDKAYVSVLSNKKPDERKKLLNKKVIVFPIVKTLEENCVWRLQFKVGKKAFSKLQFEMVCEFKLEPFHIF